MHGKGEKIRNKNWYSEAKPCITSIRFCSAEWRRIWEFWKYKYHCHERSSLRIFATGLTTSYFLVLQGYASKNKIWNPEQLTLILSKWKETSKQKKWNFGRSSQFLQFLLFHSRLQCNARCVRSNNCVIKVIAKGMLRWQTGELLNILAKCLVKL